MLVVFNHLTYLEIPETLFSITESMLRATDEKQATSHICACWLLKTFDLIDHYLMFSIIPLHDYEELSICCFKSDLSYSLGTEESKIKITIQPNCMWSTIRKCSCLMNSFTNRRTFILLSTDFGFENYLAAEYYRT